MKPADVPAGASFEPNLTIDPLLFWQDDRAQCLASIETTARRGESTSGMPTSRFPIMSRLIRKVLAVQGSSAAPERLFSFTGLRLSKLQSFKDDLAICSDVIIAKQKRFAKRAI